MSIKILAVALMSLVVVSVSGCSIIGTNAIDYPLVRSLTERELIEYYKDALTFDSLSNRKSEAKEPTYVTRPVSEERKAELAGLVRRIESILSAQSYVVSENNLRLINESTFHYIKSFLNDKRIANGRIIKAEQALGYYFVDVEYSITAGRIGTIRPQVNFLGLHGAFQRDHLNNDSINNSFITQAVAALNRHFVENRINKSLTFNPNEPNLTVSGRGVPAVVQTQVDQVIGELNTGAVTQRPISREPQIDTTKFNAIAGSSLLQSSYMPRLNLVYQVPPSDGTISGVGIFPSGSGGLRIFGFNRGEMRGTVTLRYVFKSSVSDVNEIRGVNIYPIFYEITSGININTSNVVIPDFLMTEFEKLVERSDRAIINTDLPALMSGKIYNDVGIAILRGYESQHVNLLRNISTIRRIIARDIENNAYLLEIESIRQEGPRGADVYGTYRDRTYVVIEQSGDALVISDKLMMNRVITREPSINPARAIEKRLAALNLAGRVSEENKTEINKLLEDLYTASTLRILRGPAEAQVDGEKVTIKRGMYDCFNSNTGMLSSNRKEFLNTTLRSFLVRYGVGVAATYSGIVTEWIGGASNQVEFITEEVITFQGRNTGIYLQTYYLVSNMDGIWVIDDMKFIEQLDKSGEELNKVVNRIRK